MKKIIYLLVIILLGIIAYFGIYHPAENLVYIVDSKLQGRKVYLPGKWGFVPESVIPGFVKVQKLPARKVFSERIKTPLPYAALLDYFEVFNLEIAVRAEFVLNEDNVYLLYDREYQDLEKIFFEKVQSRLQQIISQNNNNPNFSKEILINSIKEEKLSDGLNYQINVIYFPSWGNYFSMRKKLEESMNNSEGVIIQQLLENYRKLLAARADRKNLVEYFNLLSELAGKLNSTQEKEMIFQLYKLMQKGQSTDERNEKNLAEKGR